MVPRSSGSVGWWQFEALSRFDGLAHGVMSRRGGVSAGPYAELNVGLHVGDDPERVIENRRRACEENIELSGICTACHADEFFSERRLGRPTGRFAAFVALR